MKQEDVLRIIQEIIDRVGMNAELYVATRPYEEGSFLARDGSLVICAKTDAGIREFSTAAFEDILKIGYRYYEDGLQVPERGAKFTDDIELCIFISCKGNIKIRVIAFSCNKPIIEIYKDDKFVCDGRGGADKIQEALKPLGYELLTMEDEAGKPCEGESETSVQDGEGTSEEQLRAWADLVSAIGRMNILFDREDAADGPPDNYYESIVTAASKAVDLGVGGENTAFAIYNAMKFFKKFAKDKDIEVNELTEPVVALIVEQWLDENGMLEEYMAGIDEDEVDEDEVEKDEVDKDEIAEDEVDEDS